MSHIKSVVSFSFDFILVGIIFYFAIVGLISLIGLLSLHAIILTFNCHSIQRPHYVALFCSLKYKPTNKIKSLL